MIDNYYVGMVLEPKHDTKYSPSRILRLEPYDVIILTEEGDEHLLSKVEVEDLFELDNDYNRLVIENSQSEDIYVKMAFKQDLENYIYGVVNAWV